MANPQRGVIVSFVADDSRFKKGVNSASRHSKKFQKDATGLKGAVKKLGPVLNQVATRGFQAMAVGIGAGIREFANFQDALAESTAIMQVSEDQLKSMEEASIRVARTTTFSATESAKAFFFLASAGLDAEQSIGALPQVSKFAQAGAFDLALATDLLTDAQSSLGLTSKDTAKNIENMARTSDVLVKANTLANASVQQFSEALTNKAGASLKVANKTIEEGVAVLSFFADQGVKGAEAGEKLNVVLRDIPRAGARNPQLFKDMGIEIFNAEGNMKNMSDIVGEFTRVLGPMDDGLKATTLEQLGLTRSVGDAIKILLGGEQQIKAYESALKNAGGTTEEVAEKQLKSLKKQTQLAFNELRIAGQIVGKEFEPALLNGIDLIKEFAGFLQTDFVESADVFRSSLGVVGEALDMVNTKAESSGSGFFSYSNIVLGASHSLLQLAKARIILDGAFANNEFERTNRDLMEQNTASALAMVTAQQQLNIELTRGDSKLMATAKALAHFESIAEPSVFQVQEFAKANGISLQALRDLLTGTNPVIKDFDNLNELIPLVTGAIFEETVAVNRLNRSQGFLNTSTLNLADNEEELKIKTENLGRAENRLGDISRFLDDDIQHLGTSLGFTTREMIAQERQARLLDKTYRSGLFKTATALTSAFDKFQQIQERGKVESERVEDATNQERSAFSQLQTAEEKLASTRQILSNAQMDGTEVSIREQFEIVRLRDRVSELNEEFKEGTVTALELSVAQLDLDEAIARAGETSSEYKSLQDSVTRAEEDVTRAKESHKDSVDRLSQAQRELQTATQDTFQTLVEEALAVDNLQSVMDAFSGQGFNDTMQLIANKTGESFAEIFNQYQSLLSGLDGFTPPSSPSPGPGDIPGTDDDTTPPIGSGSIPPPTVDLGDTDTETSTGGRTPGGNTPVKIYTTLQIDNERFETVVQKSVLDLQRKGHKILL